MATRYARRRRRFGILRFEDRVTIGLAYACLCEWYRRPKIRRLIGRLIRRRILTKWDLQL